MSMNAIYGGIDLGTQGVRVSLFDATGALKAAALRAWPIPDVTSDLHEQDAQEWWKRLVEAGDEAFASLTAAERAAVSGLAVASTSGSLLVCDAAGRPLRPAILYSDRRSLPESAACNEASGMHFRPTFSLPKLLWIRGHEPNIWKLTRHALHPADWLTGQLCGQWGHSDETNVLKLGYDLEKRCWPAWLDALNIPADLLPQVQPSGRVVGCLLPKLARRWHLGRNVIIASGITDSNAVHLSSGSVAEGEWTTTIGTAMGIKGIAARPVQDQTGSIYSHRHPDGSWIVGGASNVGGAALNRRFGLAVLQELEPWLPRSTTHLVYPLEGAGDWFPLWLPGGRRFVAGASPGREASLLATYEGIAFVERLAYERLEKFGLRIRRVTAAGGTNLSQAFLTIRATLLPAPLLTVEHCGAAKGAALLAAMAVEGQPVSAITPRMVGTNRTVPADLTRHDYLTAKYQRFVTLLRQRFGTPPPACSPTPELIPKSHHASGQFQTHVGSSP
jgi:xylulokinase